MSFKGNFGRKPKNEGRASFFRRFLASTLSSTFFVISTAFKWVDFSRIPTFLKKVKRMRKRIRKCKWCGRDLTTNDKRIKYCPICRKSHKRAINDKYHVISNIRRVVGCWHPQRVLKLYNKVVKEEGKEFADLMLGAIVERIENNYSLAMKEWRRKTTKRRERLLEFITRSKNQR